jgi:hypothetical protein
MSDTSVPPSLQAIMRTFGPPSVHPRSPVAPDQLNEPPGPRLRLVFNEPLTKADLDRVVDYAAQFATVDVCLGHRGGLRDLSFLRRLPPITRFDMYDFGFDAFEQFEHLPDDLRELRLDQTKSTRLSLGFLRRLRQLHALVVEGHRKDIEAIADLPALRDLTLRSITLPDLSLLRPLAQLESLDLKLGGTKDLRPIAEIGKLRYLEVWQAKGLADLAPIAGMPHLQRLHLENLAQVRALPSFASLRKLRRVAILSLRNLVDVAPVAAAPALEDLHVGGMRQFEPAAFAVFRNHPTLRTAIVGLGSTRKNSEVERMLGLPPVDARFEFVA